MSNWRVERHYGFGAARIAIQPEPHQGGRAGVAEGFASLAFEYIDGGPVEAMRRVVGQTPALLLGVLLLAAFVTTLTADHSDVSPIEVVMLETIPEPLVEELLPLPVEPKIPEPPLIVEKPEPVVPKPPPIVEKPPPMIAEKPPPPPPPPAVKPAPRPRPAPPVMPQIARVEPPPPVMRPDRSQRERPKPLARPRVAIDSVAPKKPRAAQPELPRMERMARAPEPTQRSAPRLRAPSAPALDLPSEAPPERAFRVATARPTPGERPRALPGMAAAPRIADVTPPPPGPRAERATAPRPAASRRPRNSTPALAAASLPAAPASNVARPQRQARSAPVPKTLRVPRPSAQLARAPISPSAAQVPDLASRANRATPSVPQGAQASRPGVAGVPLGDLAACVSDREEDRLKQAVVAAVKAQKECVSGKGTYQFVETKNLNAFLMWIDRAPSRGVEDRCSELRNAIECLESASRRAAR